MSRKGANPRRFVSPLVRVRMRLARRLLRLAFLASATMQHVGAVPDLEGTLDIETHVGRLYVHERDNFVTQYLLKDGVWEPGETANVRALLRPGMTFLDVGAHVGYYSVLAGHVVGPTGLVLAFEPEPRNFELLRANVWRNRLTNVACFPWAVSDSCGFTELYLARENTGDHRIFPAEDERPPIIVRSVALDSLAALRAPVDVVKIDIQGAEEAAVRGMEQLLARSPNVVLSIEHWPYGMKFFGREGRNVLAYYRSLGFKTRLQDPMLAGVKDVGDDEILAICAEKGGKAHANLLLSRK